MKRVLLSFAVCVLVLVSACSSSTPDATEHGGVSPETVNPARVVLYYFHRTMRCPECLAMELFTGALVEREFANSGLVYRTRNLDTPEYEHYADDFSLEFSALVLVDEDEEGGALRWETLEDAWEKSAEQDAFTAYVTEAVRAWLDRA